MFPKIVLPPDHKLTIIERVGGNSYYLVIDDPLDLNAANPDEVKAWYDSTLAKRMAPMSDVDPAIEDRIVELETRVTQLESPVGDFPTPAAIAIQTRINSLEFLLGALVGQLLGQVAINPELLTEVAAMNRRAREASESLPETIADLREEEPIEVASRRNLLEFAKELKVPESALPVEYDRDETVEEPKRLGSETLQGPVD